MLRRLELKEPWRCLAKDFWPDDLPLGRRAVLYGHNGSGKSTLSELLLSLAEGRCATSVVWESEDKQRSIVPEGGSSPAAPIAVFTRKWVQANLSDFLDGSNASAIVTLGQVAIDAKEKEEQLGNEIQKLSTELSDVERQREAADRKVETLVRTVQDQIVSELKEFDYNRFTKNRYSVTSVRELLRKYEGTYPDSSAHAEALKRLGEGAPEAVPDIPAFPVGVAGKLAGLSEVLAETPTRIAIQSLEGNPAAQTWVEQGRELHEQLDDCLFCAGRITGQRREQLARHFDQSWLNIRSRAEDLLEAVTHQRKMLVAWRDALPGPSRLASELRSTYEAAYKRATNEVEERLLVLRAIETALRTKAVDPSAVPETPDCSLLIKGVTTAVMTEVVKKHNDQARRYQDVVAARKKTVLDHLVGSQSKTFCQLEEEANSLAEKSSLAKEVINSAESRLNELRQSRFTTKHMADTLTSDLARVYGKHHLSVVVTPDGRSYACRRGSEPATHLSDGERTTLALLYFLRKLEEEQVPVDASSQRVVVIDDPSSSLDREALFATHQWLIDSLKKFDQYIVLTHDFSLLRLFIKSQKSAWNRSQSKIKKGDKNEVRFPAVSFLEMYAASVDGKRRAKVGKLPHLLLKNTSEYGYLFSMVMAGVAESEDHERLFLLPNAARRLLEVFASYKAPHCTDFLQQLEALVKAKEGEPFRDVYDFCNRFSHGEGSESVDVLDARAAHGHIRRCMEFLRAVDPEHFALMCKATESDPATLP